MSQTPQRNKKALGISGIHSTSSAYYQKAADGMDGFQIDLLIDRDDRVINLCEDQMGGNCFYHHQILCGRVKKESRFIQRPFKNQKTGALHVHQHLWSPAEQTQRGCWTRSL